ncbi:MAG: DUF2807 domain-containing protein [Treponema sp.]|nr:DUF2807 domain-containing protein [Treponema sp.]MCL2272972.1 DUF2807 domain-containing protein [Treponema sp.]
MRKILTAALLAVLSASFLTGCVVVNLVDGNAVSPKGERENHDFRVGQYNKVKIEGYCEVHYYSASSDTATLSVQPNIREFYTVEVINEELIVRSSKRILYGSKNTPILTISTPNLNRITIEGAGVFTAYEKITSDSLDFILRGAGTGKVELEAVTVFADISGAGKLELSGRADTTVLSLDGAGELDALKLQTREARINLDGAGKVSIHCTDSLKIDASGAGAVEYRGSPSLNLNKNGLVSIRQVN